MNKKIKIEDIKYVFFDMDGTLLTSEKKPSQRTIETLEKLWKRGISCSIATGRPYYFAQNEIKTVNPHLPVISCNGALVYDPAKKSLISFSPINKNCTKKIYDILIKNDAVFLIYTKDTIYKYRNKKTNPISKWFDVIEGINQKFPKNEQTNIEEIEEYQKFNIENYDVIKFLIIYSEIPLHKYKQLEKEVEPIKDVYIVRSQNEVFDIMPVGLSKGYGLQVLDEQGIINLNNTLVFGDAENDISMFNVAKWSVAMGNAQEKTKDAAMWITDDNNNDGIANFFDKLFNE